MRAIKRVSANRFAVFFGLASLLVSSIFQAKIVPEDFNPNALWESLLDYQPEQELPITVVVPSYNNARWYKHNLDSIFKQQGHSNYEVIYLDDASGDGTGDLVENYVRACNQSHRVKVIRNTVRIGGIGNIYHAVQMSDDERIMIELDGDDWFANDHVLALINKVYSKYNPWLTYGELQISNSSRIGDSQPIPEEVTANNTIRSYEWITSALRTWKAWLFKRIKKEDLMFRGSFLPMAWDQAFMLPMVEMAGPRLFFVPDILYIYNLDTGINDGAVNGQMQGYLKMYVRRLPRYDRLPDNFVAPNMRAEQEIVVVIPSYRNQAWYERNLASVFSQDYTNYRVIYIDDCSDDGTAHLVAAYVRAYGKQDKVRLIKNTVRKGALNNIVEAIASMPDHAIVVMLDGDDWLKHSGVFSKLNETYADRSVWLTYGQFELYPGGVVGKCRPYPPHVIERNAFRSYEWIASHLRTCRAWLFKKIRQEDFMLRGAYFQMTWDQALMFPMLEMAGIHARCIEEVLYVYNIANPINDQNVDPIGQCAIERIIRAKLMYERLIVP